MQVTSEYDFEETENVKAWKFWISVYMRLMCFDNNWTGWHFVQNDPFAIFVLLVSELKLWTIFYMEPFLLFTFGNMLTLKN